MKHPLTNLGKYRVILASNSPRRRQLLEQLGVTFETRVIDNIDESYPQDLPGEDTAAYISRKKAEAYRKSMNDDELIITADTVVVCDNEVLGKPKNEEDACKMLHKLSGHTHIVVTGVTLTTQNDMHTFQCITEVDFAELSDNEIQYYVSTYQPMDKAGAYGIQEWIGCVGVTGIRGSYYNVMGLPIQRLYSALRLL